MTRWSQKFFSLTFLCMLCASIMLAAGNVVTIVHVNDTHSRLDASGPKDLRLNGTMGGIARAAYVIGAIRASEQNVVLLHAGDAFVGDFFFNTYFGVPEFQLMSGLGFDAMAVGNHEFDLTPDALLQSLSAASPSFKLLSANLDMNAYPFKAVLEQFVQGEKIIDRNGVKIGVFGLTVFDNPTTNSAPIVITEPSYASVQGIVDGLRSQGADIVVCLSHMGFLHDQDIAANVSGIDVIVGGHDHYLFDNPVRVTNGTKQTLILQAGAFYEHVGELRLNVDAGNVTFLDYRMIPLDRSVPQVPEVQAVVNSLKPGVVQQFGDVYRRIVGFSLFDLNLKYDPATQIRDTPLGNLVTDALRAKGGTQLGFSAIGLINDKIYRGAIVGNDVFRSLPYGFDPATGLGFKIVRVKVDGLSLITGIEAALSFLGVSEDYFPQVSGMTFAYKATNPVGSRVLIPSVRINGRPLNPSAVYSMTVDEGLAGLLPLLGITPVQQTPLPDYEYSVVKDYIHHLGLVAYRPEGRIRDVSVKCVDGRLAGEPLAEAAPAETPVLAKSFSLAQNYPNPFNPSTTIRYSLPEQSRTSLTVFNTLGQAVKELVNGLEEAGDHEIRFDAAGLASGVYFYRLQAGNLVQTRRMTIVK